MPEERDQTGALINEPPCENCGDTRRYQRIMMDPQRAKRFIMAECANCHHQRWSEAQPE